MLNSAFSKGSVFNVDDKTVEVRLEGDEKQIKQFIEQLQKDVIVQFGNPMITFTPFKENPALEVPDLMKSGQALMVGQLDKGIGVQLHILNVLKGMNGELKGMKQEFKNVSQGIKNLPRELGKILKEN